MSRKRGDILTMILLVALSLIATGMTLLEPSTVLQTGLVYQGY